VANFNALYQHSTGEKKVKSRQALPHEGAYKSEALPLVDVPTIESARKCLFPWCSLDNGAVGKSTTGSDPVALTVRLSGRRIHCRLPIASAVSARCQGCASAYFCSPLN